jgi:hypothetical protein
MLKVTTSVKDIDKGFKKLAGELGGAGTITLGVQGEEAEKQHQNSELTIGQVAAIHELGLGVPERSWLRTWMDENEQRCRADMGAALQEVIRGRKSRKQALNDVGYKWVAAMRENIRSGRIRPSLAASTVAAKGHNIPLLDSGDVMNSITYRLYLNQIKGIRDAGLREAVRQGPQ